MHGIYCQYYKLIFRVSGLFEFGTPAFVIRDPKLVKRLAVKEFDSFMDRRGFINEDIDPMLGKSLVFLTGQRWKGQFYFIVETFLVSTSTFYFARYESHLVACIHR